MALREREHRIIQRVGRKAASPDHPIPIMFLFVSNLVQYFLQLNRRHTANSIGLRFVCGPNHLARKQGDFGPEDFLLGDHDGKKHRIFLKNGVYVLPVWMDTSGNLFELSAHPFEGRGDARL